MPHREHYLFVCTNRRPEDDPRGSCAARGGEEVVKELKAALKRVGAASRVRACASGCLDLCPLGVSVVVEPDHVAYGGVTLADVEEIARAAAEGRVVDRLVKYPVPEGATPPEGGST